MSLVETAYAKINLALHVRKRRNDGYHELETLFAFAEDGDRLTVEPANRLSLNIQGPFAKGLSSEADNLVLRAATLLAERHCITPGAAFTLDKRLPIASGIGGGSADAAAALRLAAKLWNVTSEKAHLLDIAAELGADVPACIASQACFATGIGEQLHKIEAGKLKGVPLLLVNPLLPCPTGPVFKAWDGIDRGPLLAEAWTRSRNDLESAAIELCPAIAKVLEILRETGSDIVRMSGSGATCFALFETIAQRDAAQKTVIDACPDWWTMASSLR
ncbi:MAG: 4-(cytidine 5'-diphospho)-2-C-methyl-D-erythritol kinase [Sphingorhabdus sp.]